MGAKMSEAEDALAEACQVMRDLAGYLVKVQIRSDASDFAGLLETAKKLELLAATARPRNVPAKSAARAVV